METKLVGDRTKPLVLEESSNIAFCELSLMEEHNPIRFGMVMIRLMHLELQMSGWNGRLHRPTNLCQRIPYWPRLKC